MFSLPSIVNVDKAIHLYFHLDKFLGKMQRCMKQIVGNKNNLFSHSAASSVWRHQIIHNRNYKCNIYEISQNCKISSSGFVTSSLSVSCEDRRRFNQWEKMSHTERYQSMPDKKSKQTLPNLIYYHLKIVHIHIILRLYTKIGFLLHLLRFIEI